MNPRSITLRVIVVSLCLVLVLAGSACIDDASADSNTDDAPTAQPATLASADWGMAQRMTAVGIYLAPDQTRSRCNLTTTWAATPMATSWTCNAGMAARLARTTAPVERPTSMLAGMI